MKRRCEEGGRHRDGATIQELADETGFSEDWIYNVVESHLIREWPESHRLRLGARGRVYEELRDDSGAVRAAGVTGVS